MKGASSKMLKKSKTPKGDKRSTLLKDFLRPAPIKGKSAGGFKSLPIG